MKRLATHPAVRIFLVALVLRLIPVLATSNLGIGLDDMFQYDMLARSLASGNGYRWYAEPDLQLIQPIIHLDLSTGNYDPRGVPTSFRPPLYPAFLAIIYLAAGSGAKRFFIARLVQTVVSAVLAPMTYTLAKRLGGSLIGGEEAPDGGNRKIGLERIARAAGWIIALYPMLIIYPLALATENLFFLLMLASVLALLKAANTTPYKAGWFVLAGFLLGLTCLTRSVAQAFAVLAVGWIWFVLRDKRMAALTLLAVGVTILPWIVRNSLLYQRPTGIETALGYDLYVSYHPQSSGTFQYPQSLDLMSILDDSVRDQVGIAKAREFIAADPARDVELLFRRLGYFFGLEKRAVIYFYANNFFGHIPTAGLLGIAAILLLPFMAVSSSAAFGFALLEWRRETWLLLLLFIGYISPHIVIIAEDRFHLALMPFLAVLAATAWVQGWKGIQRRAGTRNGKWLLAMAGVLVILLFLNWGWELWREAGMLRQLLGPYGNLMYLPY